jgi:arylsulfate sulfotransferase
VSSSTRYMLIGGGVIICLIAVTMLVNSFTKTGIRQVTLENLPENRLRFKVSVAANRKCDAIVMYWKNGTADTLCSAVSRGKSHHTLWIVNTKAESNYRFQVKIVEELEQIKSKVYSFSTKVIFQATPYFTLDVIDSTISPELENKFFLTQKLSQPGAAMIINDKAEVVWYEAFEKGAKVTNWTPHRTVLCILGADSIPFSGGDEIVEVSLSGELRRQLKYGKDGMDKLVHHDVRYDTEGNIYALTFDKRVFDLRALGGNEMDSVLGDGIVMFDQHSRKVWEWSIFDHLSPLTDSLIVKDRKDWVHANALYRDHEGNFIISFRDLSQVWKIDFKTGNVIWKLGKNGDFTMPEHDLFSGQHAVYTDATNQVIMFDNGLAKKTSRVLGFAIDPHSRYVHASLDIPLSQEYFSVPKGNAMVLDHNRILICASDPKAFLIINREGKILWKVSVGGDPYRIEFIDNLIERKSI